MARGSRTPGFARPDWPRLGRRRQATSAVGGLPLPPVEIPYEWIATPLLRRPTAVINSAAISQAQAATAYATDAASIARYGVGSASATLSTAVDADTRSFASHLVTYYDTPRPRQPVLLFNLFPRTEAERQLLLSVGLGRRVRIIQTPAVFPPGAANFVVEGIRHTIAVDQRMVAWSTSALIGLSPMMQDSFNRTPVTSGWGTPDFGPDWGRAGGAASDFSTSGTQGQHLHSAAGTLKESYVDTGSTTWDVSADLSWPVASATGARISRWVCGRYTDSDNYYAARLDLTITGTVVTSLRKRVNGSLITLTSDVTVDTSYVADTVYRVRFTGTDTADGVALAARAWIPALEGDPGAAQATYQDSPASLTSGTNIALLDRPEAGNTNVPVTLSWDNAAAYVGGNPQGTPGPWFRWDTSTWGGGDLRPF